MENTSKALLIAAAVLIVILIITFGIRIYTSTSGVDKSALDTGKTINGKTGEAAGVAISELTGKKSSVIKYIGSDNKEKSKEDTIPGDDILIENERFKIFSKTTTEIKAMPYYNLKIDETPIKQATAQTKDRTGTSKFSTEIYWAQGTDEIKMSDSRNLIQQYITAYENTLKRLGEKGIIVRAAKYSEVKNLNKDMTNPGGGNYYWLGSADNFYTTNNSWINIVRGDGVLMSYPFNAESYIRPIIIVK